MTSKEKIEMIRNWYSFYLNHIGIGELSKKEIEDFNEIEKDLKVLEILKEKLDVNSVLNTYSYLAINPNYMYFKNAEEEKLIRDFLGK